MNRFFLEKSPDRQGQVTFASEDRSHIARVLRLRPGDSVLAVFGGAEYQVELTQVGAGGVTGLVRAELRPHREPEIRVTLVQGLPKGDKMETIIQKGTEIGAAAFWPAQAERSVVKLDRGKAAGRRERWQKVAREAAQQSGRLTVPEVLPVGDLSEILAEIGRCRALALMLYEGEPAVGLRQALEQLSRTAVGAEGLRECFLVIGPEGGLTEAEVAVARQAGIIPATLGPRILRTETAGPAALAAILYHFGDFGD